ncbi:hypothetical protein pb186bvf_007650 [Paramecium bursaria]
MQQFQSLRNRAEFGELKLNSKNFFIFESFLDLKKGQKYPQILDKAWSKLKGANDGFERYAMRRIQDDYLQDKKIFQLPEVMLAIGEEWMELSQEEKEFQCLI